VLVLLGRGDGTFQAPISAPGNSELGVVVADFNRDGKLDLLTGGGRDVEVLLGNGDGTFQAATAVTDYASSIAVGDFNGDGKPDLAVEKSPFGDGTGFVLLGNGDGVCLSTVRRKDGISISWPLPSAIFMLESTPSLSLTNWQSAVETPATNNGRLELTLPLEQSQRFFRLRKP